MIRRPLALLLWIALAAAACGHAPASPSLSPSSMPTPAVSGREPTGPQAARVALSMVGRPYRYGGSSPRGFDCSGLVVYSYARSGVPGLPHSAERLEARATPVRLDALAPGDLLFFRPSGKKISHVGIYVGERAFVHAPKSGRRVERVPFDHVYWGPRIRLAGRIAR